MSWSPLFMVTLRQAGRIRQQSRDLTRLERSYATAIEANHDLIRSNQRWRLRYELLLEMVPDKAAAQSMLRTLQSLDELPTLPKGPRTAP